MMSFVINSKPVLRHEDNELMGVIVPAGHELWVPSTVFGYPLASPMTEDKARHYLETNGLENLLDGWQFIEDGEWYNCIIVEAKPEILTIKISDYDHPDVHQIRRIDRPDTKTVRKV